MADPRKLDSDLSEPERRDLVRRVAEAGSRGYQIKEQTVQPSVDYAAAAQAAVKADPVVLPPSAEEELAGITGAVSADAERYAEAQRAIFERSMQRSADAGHRYFDQGDMVRDAQDFALAQYADELAAAEERRRAAAAKASSGFGSLWDGLGDDQGAGTGMTLLEAAQGLHGPRQAIVEPVRVPVETMTEDAFNDFFMTVPGSEMEAAIQLTEQYEGLWEEAMSHASAYYGMGKSIDESERLLSTSLARAGVPEADAAKLAEWVMLAHAPTWRGMREYVDAENPDRFRYAIPGLAEQTQVASLPGSEPRPETWATRRAADSRNYYAPASGQPANTPRRETYSSRWRNTTQPQTTRSPNDPRPSEPTVDLSSTAYGRLLEKYGIG